MVAVGWPGQVEGGQFSGSGQDRVVVRTVDRSAISGALLGISADGVVTFECDPETAVRSDTAVRPGVSGGYLKLELDEIVSVSRSDGLGWDGPLAEGVPFHEVRLLGGDRWFGSPLASSGTDRLSVMIPHVGDVGVDLERVICVLSAPARSRRWRGRVRRFLEGDAAGGDRLLLSNGDVVEGAVLGIESEGVRLETALGVSSIPAERIVATSIVSGVLPDDASLGVRLFLEDGTRISGVDVTLVDGEFAMRIPDRMDDDGAVQRVHVSAARVLGFETVGGRWTWMTRLAPVKVAHTPMSGVRWPHRVDRNVLGGRMHVGGRRFDRGIGVHSRSRLTYATGGQYTTFVAYYGIDDASGPLADVTVRILADGRMVHEAVGVRRGKLHGPLRIALDGVSELELVVDFGAHGGIQDRFNWVEGAFIRDGRE